MLYIFFVDLSLKGEDDIIMVSRFPPVSAQHINIWFKFTPSMEKHL